MIEHPMLGPAAAGPLFAIGTHALAGQEPAPIYGKEPISREQREQHRARLRAVETERERAAIRDRAGGGAAPGGRRP